MALQAGSDTQGIAELEVLHADCHRALFEARQDAPVSQGLLDRILRFPLGGSNTSCIASTLSGVYSVCHTAWRIPASSAALVAPWHSDVLEMVNLGLNLSWDCQRALLCVAIVETLHCTVCKN